jgi:8-oxo-dGTP pyrophosphatase MutT (NUDIX family)
MNDADRGGDDLELISAATVLLLRDADRGPEVLMLRRNSKIAFGGAWVFPGGRVDAAELDPDDEVGTARRAAVRECHEEAGLRVAAEDLVVWSHWQPPVASAMVSAGPRRRFSTWFFAVEAPHGDVRIDGGEIHEHRWLSADAAMRQHRAGEIELIPPTWVTLLQLGDHRSAADALAWASGRKPPRFHTQTIPGTPPILTWEPDVFHAGGGADDDGPRHRLRLDPNGWTYERH